MKSTWQPEDWLTSEIKQRAQHVEPKRLREKMPVSIHGFLLHVNVWHWQRHHPKRTAVFHYNKLVPLWWLVFRKLLIWVHMASLRRPLWARSSSLMSHVVAEHFNRLVGYRWVALVIYVAFRYFCHASPTNTSGNVSKM